MSYAIAGLGSNIGNRSENLNKAIEALRSLPKTSVESISGFYETKPFGVPNKQEDYLNCCILLNTKLSASMLLGGFLGIEAALGRVRTFKFAERIIDIDLLLYDDMIMNEEDLTLPHPRIKERAFVLVPLNDICKDQTFYNFCFKEEYNKINKEGVKLYVN